MIWMTMYLIEVRRSQETIRIEEKKRRDLTLMTKTKEGTEGEMIQGRENAEMTEKGKVTEMGGEEMKGKLLTSFSY